jgi:hypothetical protein
MGGVPVAGEGKSLTQSAESQPSFARAAVAKLGVFLRGLCVKAFLCRAQLPVAQPQHAVAAAGEFEVMCDEDASEGVFAM